MFSHFRQKGTAMKKKNVIALTAALLISLPTAMHVSAEEIEIQFWDMAWSGPEYIETAKSIVDQYNEMTDGVTVVYQSTPWTNWYQTFSTAIASGTAPDISTGAGYQAFQFSQIGAILPIDDVIEDMEADGTLADFPDFAVDPLKYEGKQVAFPWNQDVRVFWYNKEILDAAGIEVPKTWDEFREAAKAATNGDVYGFVTGGAGNYGKQFLITMMINNGGGIFDENRGVAVSSNERNLEAFQFISDLAKDGSINPACNGYSNDDAERAFVSGKAAFYFCSPALLQQYPELQGKVAIMDPLEGPHGDKGSLIWYNNIMIYSDTEHPEETKDFLKWWVMNQEDLFLKGGLTSLPARISTTENELYSTDENLKKTIEDWLPISKTTGAQCPETFAELNEIEGDTLLTNAIQGLIYNQDPEIILESVQSGIEDIMAKSAGQE